MNPHSFLVLMVALLMFPQVTQTLYSPALTDIGQAFGVGSQSASQTLSVFFFGFALGVVVWGRLSDQLGRRPSMLMGLAVYALGSVLALQARTIEALMLAQALAAFGAAVGSVVTQTLLRDSYHGVDLARVFSIMGIALAASPAIGLFAGASLVQFYGYRGVLICLLLLSLALWVWCAWSLPETRPAERSTAPLLGTFILMLKDRAIWRSVALVTVFNVALFSYYSLGPFLFNSLGLSAEGFGYSGVLLALGSGLGAWMNKFLLRRGAGGSTLVKVACGLMLLGGGFVLLLQNSWLFVWPMLLVVLAFGMAIPNILSVALTAYQDRLGTAGALFGLLYYLLIGITMTLVAWVQLLGWTLVICGVTALLLSGSKQGPRHT
ncbi:MAG: Bcr/CflA family efflux MFS transporter [Azonexus sp.]|uniref:Bcr/CflA family efflux MFS transporter n=1 Tax=Pseudomonas shahriarae TaxID=2745512 RepID=UPI00249B2235|nr:Bcr/CflA family efflux MFS transporter [Pseudomonas shahriarae]MDI3204954.1 Bcr/CflA family efflux MFS transporter [Pseudomonas shahriarae]MDZ4313804.1 Bcr/CflA family efflux MFS transporter [Azonexus sp.]